MKASTAVGEETKPKDDFLKRTDAKMKELEKGLAVLKQRSRGHATSLKSLRSKNPETRKIVEALIFVLEVLQ